MDRFKREQRCRVDEVRVRAQVLKTLRKRRRRPLRRAEERAEAEIAAAVRAVDAGPPIAARRRIVGRAPQVRADRQEVRAARAEAHRRAPAVRDRREEGPRTRRKVYKSCSIKGSSKHLLKSYLLIIIQSKQNLISFIYYLRDSGPNAQK